MLSAVQFVPVPATTGTCPRTRSRTNRHSVRRSSTVQVAASPVDPETTSPSTPPASRNSTSRPVASRSTSPARNGVAIATVNPSNIRPPYAPPEDAARPAATLSFWDVDSIHSPT